jgi:hypothetical protein
MVNVGGKIMAVPQMTMSEAALEAKFHRLASQWKQETAHLSSMTQMILNRNYQSIIGMGPAILPILFRELQKQPNHWFWALTAITEENPVADEDAGNLEKMTRAWLDWARTHSS